MRENKRERMKGKKRGLSQDLECVGNDCGLHSIAF